MAGENRYRWICEFFTGFTFVCFLLKLMEELDAGTVNACIGSAVVLIFSWLSSCVSDKRDAQQGIQCSKRQIISKIFRIISYIRYGVEFIALRVVGLLCVVFFITRSNEGDIFEIMEYCEIEIIIWVIIGVSAIQVLASWLLLLLTKWAISKHPMNRMQQ